MNDGNGEGKIVSPHTGEVVFVDPVPRAEDCAKNWLSGKDPVLCITGALIGILAQLELHTERETLRIQRELGEDMAAAGDGAQGVRIMRDTESGELSVEHPEDRRRE